MLNEFLDDIENPVHPPSPQEAQALENKKEIEKLALQSQSMFIEIGRLLYSARENAEWSILRYESFKNYITDMTLPVQNSYSYCTRLVNIYDYMIVRLKLDKALLLRIGISKLIRLLPAAKRGELTQDMLDAALKLSDIDLQAELGHNVDEQGKSLDSYVTCPYCGNDIPVNHKVEIDEARLAEQNEQK